MKPRYRPFRCCLLHTGLLAGLLAAGSLALRAQAAEAPLPGIRELMRQVEAHQKQLEQVRENYTYSSLQTTQDVDSNGQVKKTQSVEYDEFFVNGHLIERMIGKNGQPLNGSDQQKETERVTKVVEKAQKTPPGTPLDGPAISISRLLDIMDVRNPRRIGFRGRPTIVFDFIGRKDAKTHGIVEDASKKLSGTVWIDEADRQVAHLEVRFDDNFRIAGGLFASVEKGSSFRFDQAPVRDGLWLPTGGEANLQARLLLFKNIRQHVTERDYGFKQFHVETEQSKQAAAAPAGKP
ncbi:MAG TPA: hypothetical protein VHX20_00870 [Terracidiphilus sp.]|jgi:hypothetical protein|nr:hypothetical protein [Terracidiphilus sp.]